MSKYIISFINKKYNNDNGLYEDFTIDIDNQDTPLLFIEQDFYGKKSKPFILIPPYTGLVNTQTRFLYWYLESNPNFKVFPGQRYSLKSFRKDKEYKFLPKIQTNKLYVHSILDIEDEYKNDIQYDNKVVYMKTPNTIKVEPRFVEQTYPNRLHFIVKLSPKLIEITKDVEEIAQENLTKLDEEFVLELTDKDNVELSKKLKTLENFLEQDVDLPIQLLEALTLFVSHKLKSFTQDHNGIKLSFQKYEKELQDALKYGFTPYYRAKQINIRKRGFC
jgi:hypothetical protein